LINKNYIPMSYSSLSKAQLSFEYLHTNSTTHEFLFGAIAELIDNARDAHATELDIFTAQNADLRGGYMLCLRDNGCGMDPQETKDIITFGRSAKRSDESSAIGMYGNGLKSGSMRIGNDLILFTKKEDTMSALFLSRTFHEAESLDEVIVPLPCFRADTRQPLYDLAEDPTAAERHQTEMAVIYKYSPFKTEKEFFAQFDKLNSGSSGTLLMIYNLKLLDNGQPELDVTTDPTDVLLASPDFDDETDLGVYSDHDQPPERRSLRHYVSIMYIDPRMKVYIQNKKVQTRMLLSCLYKPLQYNYASRTFRNRAEAEASRSKEETKQADMRVREFESRLRDLEQRLGEAPVDTADRIALRKARDALASSKREAQMKKVMAQKKQKALKEPKTLTFYFGVNLEQRNMYGMFVYNCSRLIKMYERTGPQLDSGQTCRGVVGIVNVPYILLMPTHSKQDFADAKEYRALLRAMSDHLMQYWDDIGIEKRPGGVDAFWAEFGYLKAKWSEPPSQEPKYAKKRAISLQTHVQCNRCLKWRILPFQSNQVGKSVPDNWECKDNPDNAHKRCSEPEQILAVPVRVLKRKIKTKEQRQQELEDMIKRRQAELEKLTGGQAVRGRQPAKRDEEDDSEEEEEEESEEEEEEEPPAKRRASQQQQQQKKKPAPPPPARKVATPQAVAAAKQQQHQKQIQQQQQQRRSIAAPPPQKKPPPSPPKKQQQTTQGKKPAAAESSSDDEDEEEEEESSDEEEEEEVKKKAEPAKPAAPARSAPMAKRSSGALPPLPAAAAAKQPQQPPQPPPAPSVRVTRTPATISTGQSGQAGSATQQNKQAEAAASADGINSTASSAQSAVKSLTAELQSVNQQLSTVSDKLRDVLKYFCPPNFSRADTDFAQMPVSELEAFPTEPFFRIYEEGISQLIRERVEEKEKELMALRSALARLLIAAGYLEAGADTHSQLVDRTLIKFLAEKNL
ncbi:hypothetical protein BOX15_Mlig032543g1, partial [Macrostomum lignano]